MPAENPNAFPWPGPPEMTNDEWLAWCDHCRTEIIPRERFEAMLASAKMEDFTVPFRWLGDSDPIPPPTQAGRELAAVLSVFPHRGDGESARVAEEPFSM